MSYISKTGGCAFPMAVKPLIDRFGKDVSSGMTLRDYFAGQFMCGQCLGGAMPTNHFAQRAYEYADAMIAARGGA